MIRRMMLPVVLMGLAAGCLEIQGEHTLYLEPDGAVTWSVLQEEIRFDAEDPEARSREKRAFLKSVAAATHPAAVALALLHPATLEGRVLREETPQTVLTEARFPGIDRVYQNLFDLYRVPASAVLDVGKNRSRLAVSFWLDGSESGDHIEDASEEILLALLLDCRIVLTEGEFVAASGFEILDGGKVAKPLEIDTEEAEENGTPIVLSLTWKTDEASDDER
jgi:hypothetical protein